MTKLSTNQLTGCLGFGTFSRDFPTMMLSFQLRVAGVKLSNERNSPNESQDGWTGGAMLHAYFDFFFFKLTQ
jgi:hypothetical protein